MEAGLKPSTTAAWLLVMPLMVCACDVERRIENLKRDAVNAVSSKLSANLNPRPDLRAVPNPWGVGLLVYNADAVESDDVAVWLYYPDLSWSFPPAPKREQLFAVTKRASLVSSGVLRADGWETSLRRAAGLDTVTEREIRETLHRSIRQRIPVHEAIGASTTRAPIR